MLKHDSTKQRLDVILGLVRTVANDASAIGNAEEAIVDVLGELEACEDEQPTVDERAKLDQRLNELVGASLNRARKPTTDTFNLLMAAKAAVFALFKPYHGADRRTDGQRRMLMDAELHAKLQRAADRAKGEFSPVVLEKADIEALLRAMTPVSAPVFLSDMGPEAVEALRNRWLELTPATLQVVTADREPFGQLTMSEVEVRRALADRTDLRASGYESVEALLADFRALQKKAGGL